MVNNSSCLPVNNTNLNYATVGPCSVREKGPKAPEWAMEYCPTSFGPMAMVGLVIYLISFSPGECGMEVLVHRFNNNNI